MAELTVPTVDFSALGGLGDTYRQARTDAVRRQTLANLGQGGQADADALLKSGDLSLAQLGINLRNRQEDQTRQAALDLRQAERDKVADQHWSASYGLQKRAADRADEGPVETATQRAAAARANGIDPTTPQGKAYVLTGKLPEADASFTQNVEARKAAAVANGLDPNSPGYQSYVLTGKMPREDAQPLTATDKKAILEADEKVQSGNQVVANLMKAKALSKQAMAGPLAAGRGYAASFLGESSDLGKSGIATTDLNNLVTSNALQQLKTIFGGNPTEGERAILLDIQGSASQPDEVRQKIYDRAIDAAKKRLAFEQQRADELRGGSFYKPTGGSSKMSTQAAAKSQGNGADTMLQQAREAIAQGAPRDAVIQRLQGAGVDVSGL